MKGVKVEYMTGLELPPRLQGTESYLITKKRGKITLEDIEESLKEIGCDGYVCIVLKIMQDGYDGWTDSDSTEDRVYASFIDDAYDCPVCRQLTPYIHYCPECGKKIDTIKEGDKA